MTPSFLKSKDLKIAPELFLLSFPRFTPESNPISSTFRINLASKTIPHPLDPSHHHPSLDPCTRLLKVPVSPHASLCSFPHKATRISLFLSSSHQGLQQVSPRRRSQNPCKGLHGLDLGNLIASPPSPKLPLPQSYWPLCWPEIFLQDLESCWSPCITGLPNFRSLLKSYSPAFPLSPLDTYHFICLARSLPSNSPIAWSNFMGVEGYLFCLRSRP